MIKGSFAYTLQICEIAGLPLQKLISVHRPVKTIFTCLHAPVAYTFAREAYEQKSEFFNGLCINSKFARAYANSRA